MKRFVQVHEEKGGALRFTNGAGTSQSYQLLTSVRTIYVVATSLSVSEGCHRQAGFDEPPLAQLIPRRLVRGFVRLCDKGVAVIGDPRNTTNCLALSIRTRTADEHAEEIKQSLPDSIDERTGLPFGCDTVLGFSATDKWWLELSVSEIALNSLADAILNERAHSLRIGVRLRSIYTDAGQGELGFEVPIDLFLRPSISEGNVRDPEVAYGNVESWSLRFSATAELADPFQRETPSAAQAGTPKALGGHLYSEETLAALEKLIASVGSLRSTFVKAAWGAIALLALSVLIR
jgi:hypothetical protein